MNDGQQTGLTARDSRGRFLPGNPGGTGNPHSKKVQQLRSTMLKCITAKDMQVIVKTLIDKSKQGDLEATRLLFDRVLGKVPEAVALEVTQPLDYDKVIDLSQIPTEELKRRLAESKGVKS